MILGLLILIIQYDAQKVGGDGDNGEQLLYLMDAFFEMLDKVNAT